MDLRVDHDLVRIWAGDGRGSTSDRPIRSFERTTVIRFVRSWLRWRAGRKANASKSSDLPDKAPGVGWTRFYTAAVRDGEFTANAPADPRSYGRILPDGALVEITGERHASAGATGTLCGIPAGDVVLVGTAFAPNESGACSRCLAKAIDREGEPA